MSDEIAKPGHNSGLTPEQERMFIRLFPALKDEESEIAEHRGKMAGIYSLADTVGIKKEDFKWAKDLEKKNISEVIAELKRRLAIASLMGHQVGRQFDFFDKDRTPLEDAAYLEGLGAGRLRKPNANPYGMETAAGQAWQNGHNEGSKEANIALAEAMDGEVIKGSDETSDDGGDEDLTEASENDENTSSSDDDDWDAAAPAAGDVSNTVEV